MEEHVTETAPHPFDPAIEILLDRAEQFCADRRTRLTDIRRLVLGLILQSSTPVGAYDLLDRLRDQHRGAAPPTVYRALDFLADQGLIHRIERLAAFVGCGHMLECDHGGHCGHRAQFLICKRCGATQELEDRRIGEALSDAAARAGFAVEQSTIEIEGICAACRTMPEDAGSKLRAVAPRVG
ncbi:regulator protein [Tanticharoenia sakaeratensis NBRC 103193]|uniref:Regulator protein n=1 Tax=Tanticharoenia sakaeratensis NBRC 103193 TaxID=1231623 RepID=A0A0D6MHQ0_9PROT|nr:regulator protein [Tanticharoenia sakaeratensis NBRC 103193]GBQ23946.1 Fur family transcriptional regulator [Tanticharoenia sakaeratensis NBRC 103193]